MAMTAQQKAILTLMDGQAGYRSYRELAGEASIPPKSFNTQLGHLLKEGMVEQEETGSVNWRITDQGHEAVQAGETHISLQDVGGSESQIFERLGKDIGGIPLEQLGVFTRVVFSTDPFDLEEVWRHLSELSIPIDIRRRWWKGWQAYLLKSGKPAETPESLKSELNVPTPRTEEQKKQMADLGRDWDIVEGEVVRMGEGLGDYTFDQAHAIVKVSKLTKPKAEPAELGAGKQDGVAAILTALQPYLNKDANMDTLKWVVETQMTMMTNSIIDRLPAQGEKAGMGGQVSDFVAALGGLKELGPILRTLMGIPEQGAVQAQAQSQPIQVQNPDGTPYTLQLSDLLTIRKFDAEQKREDDAAKSKADFVGTVRGFMDRIGKAAERAATQQ